jgi:glycosyltransferase domain-containing protein
MKDFSLIIILHNRHRNLDRLLDYYENYNFPIFIADSSRESHHFLKEIKDSVEYSYTPLLTYTQKVEHILSRITTRYTALCADDDFMFAEGINECLGFLDKNPDYVVAQGNIIKYYPDLVRASVRFDTLYPFTPSADQDDILERLSSLFNPYKSLLYAVHRTHVLRQIFAGAGASVSNLYLNEYLTSVGPVLKGKAKNLDCLYQAREHAENSDDKTTHNLDTILFTPDYCGEAEQFINLLVNCADTSAGYDAGIIRARIENILRVYADKIRVQNNLQRPLRKKMGGLIKLIPFFGSYFVERNRLQRSYLNLKKQLSADDFGRLHEIEEIIKKHSTSNF